jgi:energy-coupling factor transporter ATP-binding protein EcfA2
MRESNLTRNLATPGKITLIMGRAGTGKTTLTRKVAASALRVHHISGVVLFDPMLQFSVDWSWLPRQWQGPVYLCRTVDGWNELDYWSLPAGMLWILDEVDMLSKPAGMTQNLKLLANYGRHADAITICNCRRPHAVHRDLTALARTMVLFRTVEPGDVRYIRDFAGQDVADKVASLEGHSFTVSEV